MKFCAEDFLLDDASWLGGPVDGDSDEIETLIENNQIYSTREIADMLKIPTYIKLLVQMKKCVFYGKNHVDVWPIQYVHIC